MSFSDKLHNFWHTVVSFFKQDILPTAIQIEQAFLAKFKTDGGKIVFSAVTAFIVAAESASGVGPILQAAEKIALQFVGQALSLGGHDLMTVILDALRVHLGAAQTAAADQSSQLKPGDSNG